MLIKSSIIPLILIMFSACQSEDGLQLENRKNTDSSISVLVYDGQKSFNIHRNVDGNFIVSKNLLSTTVGNQYLLIVEKRNYLPSYIFKEWKGEETIISLPKLEAFPLDKKGKAYISGFLTRATIGGKIHFRSGIRPLNSVQKIHIFELDENNMSKRDFFVESNSSGYFGAYVNPSNYRVEYGKRKRFHLQDGENGIFLMSIKTMID